MNRREWSARPGRSSKWLRAATRQALYARDMFACVLCGDNRLDQLTIDHIVPRVRGGGNEPRNLATLCRACNSAKQHRATTRAQGCALRLAARRPLVRLFIYRTEESHV